MLCSINFLSLILVVISMNTTFSPAVRKTGSQTQLLYAVSDLKHTHLLVDRWHSVCRKNCLQQICTVKESLMNLLEIYKKYPEEKT